MTPEGMMVTLNPTFVNPHVFDPPSRTPAPPTSSTESSDVAESVGNARRSPLRQKLIDMIARRETERKERRG